MKQENKTVTSISYVLVLTLLGKLMALFRDRILGTLYGTGMESKAFFAASFLPRVLFDTIFASAVTMSFIPVFIQCRQDGGKQRAFAFSNVFITWVGGLMAGISLLGILFSDWVAYWSVTEFDAETLALVSRLLKIMFPTTFFTGVAFSFIGILQSLERFVIPALTSVVFNTVILLYFFSLNSVWGITGLAFVYLLGWVLQAGMQIPSLVKEGYRFRLCLKWNADDLRHILALLLPVMVSTWVQPVNILMNTRFASGLYEGDAVSGLHFANNLYTMTVGVFVLAIMNVVFPKMSALAGGGEKREMVRLTADTLKTALFFVFPMMLGLMSISREVIGLVYAGDKFDDFAVAITAQAFFYFSMGMLGYTLQVILSRVYFAERKGMIPMLGAVVAIGLNGVLSYLWMPTMEIGGLALASSVSGTVYGLILFIPIAMRNRQTFSIRYYADWLKMLIAAWGMGAVVVGLKPYIAQIFASPLRIVMISTAVGAVIYFLAVWLLRVSVLVQIKEILKKKQVGKTGGKNEVE